MQYNFGKAERAVCRCIRRGSCGSGTIVGVDDNGSFVMTNAHVVGSDRGGRALVEVESRDMEQHVGRIVRAAYSSRHSADWALMYVEGLTGIEPVYMDNRDVRDGERCYTKGFPECRAFEGSWIDIKYSINNGVYLWDPDAIGGQSGSGVFSTVSDYMLALLTWSMSHSSRRQWYGAGQSTSEIWSQNRDFKLRRTWKAPLRLPDWEYKEMSHNPEDEEALDRFQITEKVLQEGIFGDPIEQNIQDYPIWRHMFPDKPPVDPDDPESGNIEAEIAKLKEARDLLDESIQGLESGRTTTINPHPEPDQPENSGGPTFGLP